MNARHNAAFSLIEALVALIIAAIALAGVLELQRQLADGQQRYERALMVTGLQRDTIALMSDINPTETPRGAAALTAGRSISWTSAARSQPVLNTGAIRVGRAFEMQLFRVNVTILDRDGSALGTLAFDRVGWRKLANPAPYVPPPPPGRSARSLFSPGSGAPQGAASRGAGL